MYNLHKDYPDAIVELFEQRLHKSHVMRSRILIRDWSGQIKEEITELLSGDIAVEMGSTPHRRLDCAFNRPKTRFDEGDIWINDIFQVFYEVYVPELNTATYNYRKPWVSVPVFWGHLLEGGLRIEGNKVYVMARGGEQQWNYSRGGVLTIPAGTRHSEAVQIILDRVDSDLSPANIEYGIQQSSSRLVKAFNYGSSAKGFPKRATPWMACKVLADGAGGKVLYVDGTGRVRFHETVRSPVMVLDEDDGVLLDEPTIEARLDGFANNVVVHGATKDNIQFRGSAEAVGDFAPTSTRRRLTKEVVETSAGSDVACENFAKKILAEAMSAEMAVDVTAFVEPRLQEGDWFQVNRHDRTWVVPARTFNIPLLGAEQIISSAKKSRLERIFAMSRTKVRRQKRRTNRVKKPVIG